VVLLRKDRRVPAPKTFDDVRPNEIGRRGEKNLRKVTGCILTPGSGAGMIMGNDDELAGLKATRLSVREV